VQSCEFTGRAMKNSVCNFVLVDFVCHSMPQVVYSACDLWVELLSIEGKQESV
jgi:hypothetical protein